MDPKSLDDFIDSYSNIVIVVGAGLSVSCGIPDFRSPAGLYANLNCNNLGLTCPEDLFDLEFFTSDPLPFYRFAKSLYVGEEVQPSDGHRFLKDLHEKGKLLRVYTQNIDGLEVRAGVPPSKVVYAHGSLGTAKCVKCGDRVEYRGEGEESEAFRGAVRDGIVPLCRKVVEGGGKRVKVDREEGGDLLVPRPERPRRSSSRTLQDPPPTTTKSLPNSCNNVLKPSVTFFGEKLSNMVGKALQADKLKADCLIVVGTSLSVAPMSGVMEYLGGVSKALVNRDWVWKRGMFDIAFIGDIDTVVGGGGKIEFGGRGAEVEVGGGSEEKSGPSPQHQMVIICDLCGETCEGGESYKCEVCFDYDICGKCYRKGGQDAHNERIKQEEGSSMSQVHTFARQE